MWAMSYGCSSIAFEAQTSFATAWGVQCVVLSVCGHGSKTGVRTGYILGIYIWYRMNHSRYICLGVEN